MRQLRTVAVAFVVTAVLGPVMAGCDPDTSDSGACSRVESDYKDFSKRITRTPARTLAVKLLAEDLQVDTDAVAVDVDVYAGDDVEKPLTRLRKAMQQVTDTAQGGTVDVTPLDAPLPKVNDACGLSLKVPVVPVATSAFDG